jgi:hypothetical protein
MLQDLANLAQVVSAVVAAVALVVLAIQARLLRNQIRDQVRSQRTAQYQAAMTLMFNWRSDLINKPELAERLREPDGGSKYFQDVLDRQGVESYFHTLKLFHIFEIYFILHREGVIDESMWQGWKKNVAILMTPKQNRELWATLKSIHVLNRDFETFVDEIIEQKLQSVA